VICANDQLCTRRLVWVLFLIFDRLRMLVKFSSTIVAPGEVDRTICLEST
jgi:hypothetical protein